MHLVNHIRVKRSITVKDMTGLFYMTCLNMCKYVSGTVELYNVKLISTTVSYYCYLLGPGVFYALDNNPTATTNYASRNTNGVLIAFTHLEEL